MRIDIPNNNIPIILNNTDDVTIHHVYIIDKSGSMGGDKWKSAKIGLTEDINVVINDTEINQTITLIMFSDYPTILSFMLKSKGYKIPDFGNTGGLTALYQTVGEAIEKVSSVGKPTDKYLLKIFTDGGENASKGKFSKANVLSELISKVEKENGFTVTFIGTEEDVDKVIRNLSIKESNTLTHNNTDKDILEKFNFMANSTKAFSKKVLLNQDVSQQFYSNK